MNNESKFKRIQCIDRALDIIEAAASGEYRTVSELAEAVKLNGATAYNIVKTLMARDFLIEKNGTYQIGHKLGLMAQKWDIASGLPTLVRPLLAEIGRILGNEHVSVAMRSGGGIETVMLMPDTPEKYHNQFLYRDWDDPLILAAGRVIVAFEEEKDWMKTIENHLNKGCMNLLEKEWNHYNFYKHLEEIRSCGGVTLRIQNPSGNTFGAAAAPIFSPAGVLLGAIGASCLAEEATGEHLGEMLNIIKDTIANNW